MTAQHSSLPSLPLRLSALQILGLRDPLEGDWARLRALQYANIHRAALMRAVSHAIGGLIVVGLFSHDVPAWLLYGWIVALGVAVWNVNRIDKRFSNIGRGGVTRAEYNRQAFAVALFAMIWSVALLLFPPFASSVDAFALWTMVAMLIAGSAGATPAAPIARVIFTIITGAGGVGMFVVAGEYAFAAVTLAFVAVAAWSTVETARTYLSARIAEAGVAEKDEVVSLLLREFEENEADWLWQIDTNRRVRTASPRFAYAVGRDPSSIEGVPFIQLIAGSAWENGNFPPSLHDLAERLKARESFSNLLVQVDVADGGRWWELSGTPMLDEKDNFVGFRGVGSDVTERRESDEKIAYLARYDTLTGLPNRLMLIEALGEAMRYAEQWRTRCAFLMIDLDRFKSVNDSLGHHIGDRLLAQVSERLRKVSGNVDQCGRLGGDEFAIVIKDASTPGHVEQVASAVIHALTQPYAVDHHTLFIGASVGSAIGPRDGTAVETLMRNADLALYRAKGEGGGLHCQYEPSMHADVEEKRRLELSLRQAIDRGELQLNFQPVVDATDEKVVSFEALLRWNSAEHGVVSPGKFIPLAEGTRLIVPIGNWVLHEACREAAAWPGQIRVAVNVSGEQLLEPDFASHVIRALADSGLPAHRLEVEVTESVFLRDGRTARATLEEIMALGCSIALDDFGTGYSSLGYLRTLRFSTIKVDHSFVQGAARGSRESLAIIRAVVAMAQSLEMSTTAEGVETEDEVRLVRELGCNKIQGYHFGRPVQAAEALRLATNKNREVA